MKNSSRFWISATPESFHKRSQIMQSLFSQLFLQHGFSQMGSTQAKWGMVQRLSISLSSLLLGLSLTGAGGAIAQSQNAEPTQPQNTETTQPEAQPQSSEAPPPELATLLSQIDAAANQRDLQTVMGFFSQSFTHSDGLTYRSLEEALTNLWERFPTLTYQTELNSWERDGNAIVAETTTTITGTQPLSGQDITLNATVGSRQRIENGQIVRQEILAEQSSLRGGTTPPTVNMMLPEEVVIGRSFNFDAVVQEPLGNRLLLGAAVEEPIQSSTYLNPTQVDLELLSAGGLFKIGRAPALPDDRWISAVIVRDDGITVETRRLSVVGRQ